MLEQMKVLSLCHYLQGPGAVQYLADLGADVIKIEPLGGAFERSWSGADVYLDGVSAFYLCANKNKRSLTLNLKQPAGRDIFMKLLSRVDVLVENFRPGTLERLGLGYETLKACNPQLIYASATGFGAGGPMRDKPGQDLLLQARTGLMTTTGRPSDPRGAGCAVIDQHGAALLAMGILAAYVRRSQTGEGCRVEGSLFNAGIDLQFEAITAYLCGDFQPSRFERGKNLSTWYHQAPYGVYEAADGFVAISNSDPLKLADALSSDTLRAMAGQDRFVEREDYAAEIARAVRGMTRAEIGARFDERGLWQAPVRNYGDLPDDPQSIHNKVFRKVRIGKQEATLVNHPIRYDGQVPGLRTLALKPGEHSNEILEELGFTAAQIRQFVANGVTTATPDGVDGGWQSFDDPRTSTPE